MTPTVSAPFPVWLHVVIAMTETAIALSFVYGCLLTFDSPLSRHLLGRCERRACVRCIRREAKRLADERAKGAGRRA